MPIPEKCADGREHDWHVVAIQGHLFKQECAFCGVRTGFRVIRHLERARYSEANLTMMNKEDLNYIAVRMNLGISSRQVKRDFIEAILKHQDSRNPP